ncbi:MAG: hypothetical protein WC428_08120 [Candidatus Paceibacterota bacterium]|jgi:hypothetical protein
MLRWWDQHNIPIFILCETNDFPYNYVSLMAGPEKTFSDMLIWALQELPYKYIFYLLEDCWLIDNPPFLQAHLNTLINKQADAIRLLPNHTIDTYPYQFIVEDGLLRIQNESMYQMSLSPSIWNREFFMDQLIPGENPWQIELDGTRRLSQKDHKIYFVPDLKRWYLNTVHKGYFTDKGKELQKQLYEWHNRF